MSPNQPKPSHYTVCHITSTIGNNSTPNPTLTLTTGTTIFTNDVSTCFTVLPVSSGSPLAQSQLGLGSVIATMKSIITSRAPVVPHASGTDTTLVIVLPSGSTSTSAPINLPLILVTTTHHHHLPVPVPGVVTLASSGDNRYSHSHSHRHSHRHGLSLSLSPSR